MNKSETVIRNFFELDTQDLQSILFESYRRGFNRALERTDKSRHLTAHWVTDGMATENDVQRHCSNCNAGDVQAMGVEVPYCWKCGAKMKAIEIKEDKTE